MARTQSRAKYKDEHKARVVRGWIDKDQTKIETGDVTCVKCLLFTNTNVFYVLRICPFDLSKPTGCFNELHVRVLRHFLV